MMSAAYAPAKRPNTAIFGVLRNTVAARNTVELP